MANETKKEHLQNGNAQSNYSTSSSPDIRRRSPRGKPIATPTCSTSDTSSQPNTKKRKWNNRGGIRSKKSQAPKNHSSQPHKANTSQKSNDNDKSANTNSTPEHPQNNKKQKRSNRSTSKSTNEASTRVTRSRTRQQTEQEKENSDKDSTKTKTKGDTFVVPRKHHIKTASNITSLSSLEKNGETPDGINTVECPYCLATISLVHSKILASAYNDIKRKDQAYDGQPPFDPRHDSEQDGRLTLPTHQRKRKAKRPVALMEQYSFCQLHDIELVVKPHGIKLGWPTVVRFDALEKRILRFKEELDKIIAQELESSYRKMALDAYNTMGKNQARSTLGRMARFETTLPGYYGTKGASIIQESLARMYLHPGKLDNNVTTPQTAIEYLQQVLIPEVGFRLIREDMIKKDKSKRNDPDIDDQAKSVMSESVSFGSYLQPLDWHDSVSSDEE